MAVDSAAALISLANLKTFLKITGSGDDSILEMLIDRISVAARNYCGRHFISKERTEYYDGNGLPELILRNFPIISIASLYNSTDNRDFSSAELVDTSANVLIKKEMGIIRLWNNEHSFIRGNANIKIVYTAGYATIPYDLQLAVQRWCAKVYKDYVAGIWNVQSQTIAENTTSYLSVDMPTEVKGLLDKFRIRSYCPDFSYSDTND